MFKIIIQIFTLITVYSTAVVAQNLPPHDLIDILIVSDEVNPHNLSDSDLMQPGDLSHALGNSSALNTHIIIEIDTNEIELATQALNLPASHIDRPEVLIYFAHRIPNNGNNDTARQAAFVTAVENFLQTGGGVIAFHHGIYFTSGKQAILNILGAQTSGAVPWDTVNGQDIIFVGDHHFIGNHQINYSSSTTYSNPAHGIAAANYPYFNNTPDERYPQLDFNSSNNGCEIEPLFQSNYTDNGNQHLLSYTKQCPEWTSKVVVYQPGEYQPNATSGNNFQVLLNAIYYLADYHWDIIFKHGFQ